MRKKLLLPILLLPFTLAAQTTLYNNDFSAGGGDFTLGQGNNFDTWIVNNVYNCSSTTPNQNGGNYMHIYDDLGGDYCAHAGFYGSGGGATVYATKKTGVNTVGHPVVTITFDWLCQGQTGSVLPSYGFIDYSTNGSTWVNITQPIARYNGQSSWTTQTITSAQVPAFLNQTTLFIRFGWTSSGYGLNPSFAIDNLKIVGSTGTGINEQAAISFLNVSPNPFADKATIVLNKEVNGGELIVSDICGREVKRQAIGSTTVVLEKGDLKTGVYFISITDKSGRTSEVKKVVIQ